MVAVVEGELFRVALAVGRGWVVVVADDPDEAAIVGNDDSGAMLGEEGILGEVVPLKSVEKGKEDGVWYVGGEMEVTYFGKLGGGEGTNGSMGGRTGEENGESSEKMGWVGETMGTHGSSQWREGRIEKSICIYKVEDRRVA